MPQSYIFHSDRDIITLNLNINNVERGPEVWKMDLSTIQSLRFQESIEHLWPQWIQSVGDYDNMISWWEMVKYKIKQLTIETRRSLNLRKSTVDKYEKRIHEKKDSSESKHKHEYTDLKCKIEEYYNNQLNAVKIRSRVNNSKKVNVQQNSF